jgi:hypothetical protein
MFTRTQIRVWAKGGSTGTQRIGVLVQLEQRLKELLMKNQA